MTRTNLSVVKKIRLLREKETKAVWFNIVVVLMVHRHKFCGFKDEFQKRDMS